MKQLLQTTLLLPTILLPTTAMAYYFEADGQEFFICNFQVYNDAAYSEWYSNYDEVFG